MKLVITFIHPVDHEPRARFVNGWREAMEVILALRQMGISGEEITPEELKRANPTALPLLVNPWQPEVTHNQSNQHQDHELFV